ncbi:MAG: tRNA preQ1(34) S-adenosylmethionine ribosyltransferase-isomerase QueA, partial [Phycisphaerales bacterium]|nr:tRNA preQ1(34) S-adenosylmethionine ribosyltransferase-isomerase QueA [Phycisphaerales bacterium]
MSKLENQRVEDGSFRIAELDYQLPHELIAQSPAAQRDLARLLIVDRAADTLDDGTIREFSELLRPDDLLVLNDTRVLPARFYARRVTGGLVRGLFLAERDPGVWRVMLEGSRRLRVGETMSAGADAGRGVPMTLLEACGEGHWLVRVDCGDPADEVLERIGLTPLPPYIRRKSSDALIDATDRSRYQTVYARRPGAVAAPTAGLHLTESMLDRIRERGVEIAFVTLHVGLGTFKAIAADRLADHVMHEERYELPEETAQAAERCRRRGGRIVAVGTTTVRVLETAARNRDDFPRLSPGRGSTGIFIYPPYAFRVVDALLTNFHLPRSTLLALVMAFAGVERTRRAYAYAVTQAYRF